MRVRTTLILLVIAAALLGYVLLVEKKQPSTEELEKQAKQVFPMPKTVASKGLSDLIDKISLKTDKLKLAAKKVKEGDEERWRLTEPIKARADKGTIRSILTDLEFMEKEATVRPEKGKKLDLAAYGLDKPKAIIKFTAKTGRKTKEGKEEEKSFTLLLGNKTPVGNYVYVKRTDEDKVYTVSDSIVSKTEKTLNDFRDKQVVHIDKDKVDKVEVAYGKVEFECSATEEGWRIARPFVDFADADKIKKLIDKVDELKIDKDDFITDDDSNLAKYGLDKPQLTVSVYQEGAGKTILFGKTVEGKKGKIYAKRKSEPTIFALKSSVLKDFKILPADLRSKNVVAFKTDDVKKIELKIGGKEIDLEKKDANWKIVKPKEKKADYGQVSDFLRDLGKLKIYRWIDNVKDEDLAKYGLKKPVAQVTLILKEKKGKRTILIGKKAKMNKEEVLYVKRGGLKQVLEVSPTIYDNRIAKGELAFRDRLVLEFTKSKAKKLVVARQDKTFVCEKGADDKWRLTKPIKAKADKTAVDDILWDISYLKARELIEENPKDLAKYGLDKPYMKVTVVYDKEVEEKESAKAKKDEKKANSKDKKNANKDEKKKKKVTKTFTTVILVGKKAPKDGERYAKLKDGNLVFTLGTAVLDNLEAELANRTVVEIEKDAAKVITLTYPSATVVLEKGDGTWKMKKPREKTIPKSEIDDILNTLEELRAKSIKEYTPKNFAAYGLDKPSFQVSVKVSEGEKWVKFGKKAKDGYYARSSGNDFIYVVARDKVERMMKEKPPAKPAVEMKPAPKKAGKKPAAVKKSTAKPAPKKPVAKSSSTAPKK